MWTEKLKTDNACGKIDQICGKKGYRIQIRLNNVDRKKGETIFLLENEK